MAARPGLEPGNSDPKPDVLPITLPGKLIAIIKTYKIKTYLRNSLTI